MAVIKITNLCKTYHLNGIRKTVADSICVEFPARSSVALLGRNGAGKSSLLRMIAGTMSPDSGAVTSAGAISWPVGYSGSFHPDLTGAQNTRFIARAYGVETEELISYVTNFSELGQHFDLPVHSYSSGMRARLAFGISMGIRFDVYLIDEVTAVGDAGFKQKCKAVLKERLRNSSAVVVSHNLRMVRDICTQVALLESGRLTLYDDIEEGIRHHREIAINHLPTGEQRPA